MSGRRWRRRLLVAAAATALAALAWPQGPVPSGYGGAPRAEAWWTRLALRELHNPGFTVGYSEWRRQPLWVAFEARAPGAAPLPPRPQGFTVDERTLARVSSEDYRDSGYDRGHLAPNFLIGKLYGRRAQLATFLMSNVAPQRPRLNGLVWQRLEEAEADVAAPGAGALWVITGPLFGKQPAQLRSGVPVPEAFYRIWLDPDPQPRALAFRVPQDVCGTEPLSRYLASIDAIEQASGLDFLRELDDAREAALEAGVRPEGWDLRRFDRLPPRYADRFGPLRCPAPAEDRR